MIIVALAVFGIIFGSFINAWVWRLRKQDELAHAVDSKKEKKSKASAKKLAAEKEKYSILRGRSMCPHCEHVLAAKDLVPLFSWLSLGGKCRYCRAPISWQYPVVELVTGLVFALSYVFWPYGFDAVGIALFAAWLVFVIGFMVLTVYDIRWQELPDEIVWPLNALALLQVLLSIHAKDIGILWGGLMAVGVIAGLFWILFEVSKGRWIGFGDVKLGIALGLLAGGPLKALLVLFAASLLGTLVSLPTIIKRHKNLSFQVPFGPFLIAGLAIVYFWGDQIIEWYTKLFF